MEKIEFRVPHPIDGLCVNCGEHYSITVEHDDLITFYGPRTERPFIQDLFPYLTAGERELFFQSGICESCWPKIMGSDDE
jgi:hypothetical protein